MVCFFLRWTALIQGTQSWYLTGNLITCFCLDNHLTIHSGWTPCCIMTIHESIHLFLWHLFTLSAGYIRTNCESNSLITNIFWRDRKCSSLQTGQYFINLPTARTSEVRNYWRLLGIIEVWISYWIYLSKFRTLSTLKEKINIS